MKVVAFNGSPKPTGNTFRALRMVAEQLEKENIEVQIVHVGNQCIRGCIACNWCARHAEDKCVFRNDPVNDWIELIKQADGILLGSPVYFSGINGTLKSFLDRAGYVLSRRPASLRYKVGASVVAVRRSGGIAAFDELNHYLNYFEMILPGSNYWNVIHGMSPGEAEKDEEGKQIMRTLGRNMAWLMKAMELARVQIPQPEPEKKIGMNFIR